VANGLASVGLRETMQHIRFPAWIVAPDGRMIWLNDAARRTFGDVEGRLYTSLVAPAYVGLAQDQFTRKLLGELVTDYRLELIARDGSHVPVEVSTVALRRPGDDVPMGIFGIGYPDEPVHVAAADPELTPRQAEVLRHLANGRSTEQIADEMQLSVETVRNHIRALLRKLRVHSRLAAVAEARRRRLVS
jgi:PAS domain S-box-containing protein